MKKIVLLHLLLLLWMGQLTYAQVAADDVSTLPSRNIKLELQSGSNIIYREQWGVWGEYSWNEIWGARIGICWDRVSTGSIKYKISSSNYLTLPILLAARPDLERNFLLFSGVQLGVREKIYVTEVEELNRLMKTKDPVTKEWERERRQQLKDKLVGFDKDKTSRFQVGLVAGVDYEFSFGLTIGLYGVKYLIDPGKGTCYKDWKLHPSWSIFPTIGYNLVRIWDFLHKPSQP